MNSAERWERIKDIFEGALSRSGGERRAFLEGACSSDPEMLREVESLLASFDADYLEGAAVEAVADSFVSRNTLEFKPGTMLGQYRIVSELGKGGQGAVYLAEDTNLHRTVAIKALPRELTIDETAQKRFQREARLASSLDHPNICSIHDLAEVDGTHFIVMQYVEGKNVRELVSGKPLELTTALKIGIQVCDALAEAHARGIIHRDIKAHNVIVTSNGNAKVLDFGLAKLTHEDDREHTELTALGSPYGTPTYAAPEQSRGEKVDHRADVFSAGVLMYEMLTGTWAFHGNTSVDVRHAVLHEQPEPIQQRRKSPIPARLDEVVMRALKKEPEKRFQRIADMRNAMIDILLALPTGDDSDTADFIGRLRARGPFGRGISRTAVILGVAASVIMVAILGYLAFRGMAGSSVAPAAQRKLTRFTFDPGLQSEPSWSRDGQYIAYHSDQGGNFDIWIQQVSGGDPVQVTKSTAHDWQPDFSPSGENIVFRSEREGGGLFIMQALGGGERRISSYGYHPRWSPDGKNILFYNSNLNGAVTVPKLFVQAANSKDAVEVWPQASEEFQGFLRADWHPDGTRVSFLGQHRQKGFSFWTVPIKGGGPPVRSDVSAEVELQMKATGVAFSDFVWGASGTSLYLEGDTNAVKNLWRVTVEPDSLRWIGGPDRLTTGAGSDTDISVSPDGKRLAFTTRSYQTRIMSAPLVGDHAKGDLEPLTSIAMDTGEFNLSRDRKKLIFAARRAGKMELWERSMTDGKEKLLLTAGEEDMFSSPRWSPDGSQVAFALNHNPDPQRRKFIQAFEKSIVLLPTEGRETPLTSANVLQGWPWDWSPDGRYVLGSSAVQTPDPEYWGLYLFPLSGAPRAESQQVPLMVLPGYNIWQGRFSPDGKWVTFLAVDTADEHDAVIGVVPATGGPWTRLAIEDGEKPRWGPDGRTIYFYSGRGGSRNVWGIRFDPRTGTSVGDPFKVTSFESPNKMLMAPPSMGPHPTMLTDLVVDTDKLLFNVTQMTGSIWILDNVDR